MPVIIQCPQGASNPVNRKSSIFVLIRTFIQLPPNVENFTVEWLFKPNLYVGFPKVELPSVVTTRPPTPSLLFLTSLGVMHKLGLTSSAGFLSKKFLGRSNNVMGSAGMTGKSSGEGKCVMPKVCQRTTSVSAILAVGDVSIHSGIPREGVPEV